MYSSKDSDSPSLKFSQQAGWQQTHTHTHIAVSQVMVVRLCWCKTDKIYQQREHKRLQNPNAPAMECGAGEQRGELAAAGHGEGAAAGGGGTADIRGAACMRLACDVLCGCFRRASNLTLGSSQLNECAIYMSHTYENLDTKDP